MPLVKTNVDVATIPHPLPDATPGYAVSRLPLPRAMRAARRPPLAHTYTASPTAYIFHMAVEKKWGSVRVTDVLPIDRHRIPGGVKSTLLM